MNKNWFYTFKQNAKLQLKEEFGLKVTGKNKNKISIWPFLNIYIKSISVNYKGQVYNSNKVNRYSTYI